MADSAEETVLRVGEVTADLNHPFAVRLMHDAGDLHGAALQSVDEEHEVADQAAEVQDLDGEEVRSGEFLPVRVQEHSHGVRPPRSGGGSMP